VRALEMAVILFSLRRFSVARRWKPEAFDVRDLGVCKGDPSSHESCVNLARAGWRRPPGESRGAEVQYRPSDPRWRLLSRLRSNGSSSDRRASRDPTQGDGRAPRGLAASDPRPARDSPALASEPGGLSLDVPGTGPGASGRSDQARLRVGWLPQVEQLSNSDDHEHQPSPTVDRRLRRLGSKCAPVYG
jgi:hypothetical protein